MWASYPTTAVRMVNAPMPASDVDLRIFDILPTLAMPGSGPDDERRCGRQHGHCSPQRARFPRNPLAGVRFTATSRIDPKNFLGPYEGIRNFPAPAAVAKPLESADPA